MLPGTVTTNTRAVVVRVGIEEGAIVDTNAEGYTNAVPRAVTLHTGAIVIQKSIVREHCRGPAGQGAIHVVAS